MQPMSRRELMERALLTATVPALGLLAAHPANAVPLDPNDPAAKSLGYVSDASKVDAKANPTYKPGQHCASCAQFQGKPTDASAGCTIFGGKTVPAGGWCKVWVQRPG